MFPENPGVDLYRKYAYIIKTSNSAAGASEAIKNMSRLAKKIINVEEIGRPDEEGYIQRGLRRNIFVEKTGEERSIDMLLSKIKGEPYVTELPMPVFEKFTPSPAIKDISKAKIAVLTTGGFVPLGNPDRLEACNCTKFKKYSLKADYSMDDAKGQVVHGGYDPTYGNENGNRILPVDAMMALEKEGHIGKLYENTFVTVGNGMGTDQAAVFGKEIAKKLLDANVQGAILTST
jgi:glycine reductase